jgi:hypothetical protein
MSKIVLEMSVTLDESLGDGMGGLWRNRISQGTLFGSDGTK